MNSSIEELLGQRRNELQQIENDIKSLKAQADNLKEYVIKYNELKKRESELRKEEKKFKKEILTVLNFLQKVDQTYVDKYFPLFSEVEKSEETAEIQQYAQGSD